MDISVVIPAYNAEKVIGGAIRSCQMQSEQPLEIIVVLDACTDGTVPLLKRDFPQVHLIELKENRGPSFARNAGLNAAKGDWVAFLDADDEWHPQKLAILAACINRQPEIKAIIHPFTFSEETFPAHLPANPLTRPYFFSLLLKNLAQGSCICLNRKAGFAFDESFRYCEDHELALRLAWQKGLFYLPYPLTKLGRPQLSAGGLSGNRWAMRKGELRMYARLWRLHVLWLPLIPFLLLFSLLKHLKNKVNITSL